MKVALVHDWLTAMRGGEKCLEIFCRLFPDADLFTLFHSPAGFRRSSRIAGFTPRFFSPSPSLKKGTVIFCR